MNTLTPGRLAFAAAGLAHPFQVGTVLRTSPRDAADMLGLAAPELAGAAAVAELGADNGAITGPLLAWPGLGARVLAVEVNPGLARRLEARLGGDPGSPWSPVMPPTCSPGWPPPAGPG